MLLTSELEETGLLLPNRYRRYIVIHRELVTAVRFIHLSQLFVLYALFCHVLLQCPVAVNDIVFVVVCLLLILNVM